MNIGGRNFGADDFWEAIMQLEPEDRIILICVVLDQYMTPGKLSVTRIGKDIHAVKRRENPDLGPFDRNRFQRDFTRAATKLARILMRRFGDQ